MKVIPPPKHVTIGVTSILLFRDDFLEHRLFYPTTKTCHSADRVLAVLVRLATVTLLPSLLRHETYHYPITILLLPLARLPRHTHEYLGLDPCVSLSHSSSIIYFHLLLISFTTLRFLLHLHLLTISHQLNCFQPNLPTSSGSLTLE